MSGAEIAASYKSVIAPLYPASQAPDGVGGETETVDYAGTEIVLTFGAPQAEYAAIRKAAGVMDLPQKAVLELTGKDRNSFLDNFLTNQLFDKAGKKDLPSMKAVRAFLLNGKGRIVADMQALLLPEKTWLVMDRRVVLPVKTILEKYHFTEKAIFALPEVCVLAVHGPNAAMVVSTAGVAGQIGAFAVGEVLNPTAMPTGTDAAAPIAVYRQDVCGVPGLELVVPAAIAQSLWKALTEPYAKQQNKRDSRPIGWAAFNTARVEAGTPLFGIDFTEESLAAESGVFESAVSVTKGCYLGQEIVARMYARQVVAKKVVGVKVEGGHLPIEGAALTDPATSNEVGRVTSSTVSPLLSGAAVGLAVVKKPFFEVGTVLSVPAEGAMRQATVVGTPFV